MKPTLLAQKIALDFCKSAQSGYDFTGPDNRESLAAMISRFLVVGDDIDDRAAAMELSLRLLTGIGKNRSIGERVEMMQKEAQAILDWISPAPKKKAVVAKTARKKKRGGTRRKP